MNNKKKIAILAATAAMLIAISNKSSNKDTLSKEINPTIQNEINYEDEKIVQTEPTRLFEPKDLFTPVFHRGYITNDTLLYDWYTDEKTVWGTIDKFQGVNIISTNGVYSYIENDNHEVYYVLNKDIELLPDSYIESDLSDKITTLAYEKEIIGKFTVSIGAPDTPTDEGYFEIKGKDYNRYLDGPGYHTYVNYFFYYNGGEGFHNLPGYTTFGEEVSHGCTRMRDEDIKLMDKYVYEGMKVLVHK